MKISLFVSSVIKSVWAMVLNFAVGSCLSPRAYKERNIL